jgi:hypothetical protein
MRTSFAIFLTCLAHLASAQSTDDLVTLSGTVTDSATGRGVPGALVTVAAGPTKSVVKAFQDAQRAAMQQGRVEVPPNFKSVYEGRNLRLVTDGSGAFRISIPEPVTLSLQVSRTGYSSGFQFVQNQQFSNLSVRLSPLGVIEGRVSNADGEPVPGVTVEVYIWRAKRTSNRPAHDGRADQ